MGDPVGKVLEFRPRFENVGRIGIIAGDELDIGMLDEGRPCAATLAVDRQVDRGRNEQAFVREVTRFLTSELRPSDALWTWLDQVRYGCPARRLSRPQAEALVKRIRKRLLGLIKEPASGSLPFRS